MSSTQEAGEIFGEGRGPAHAMLRSPTALIASVGLWGMNVFFFRLFRIDYVKVMKHDLMKLDELDQQENKETSPVNHRPVTSTNPPVAGQLKHLVQRQHSNGAMVQMAASASTQTNTSPQASEEEEEHEIHDEEEQQHLVVDPSQSHTESDASITWEKLVGLSMLLLVFLHSTY